MIETTTRGIFLLIKSALTGESYPLPEGFDLTKERELIRKHQIENLIYYGAVNCGMDRSSALMRELFSVTCRYLYIDECQRWEMERIRTVFEENGIDHMPLKGVLMKALYPRTDMRIMGDGDILIRLEQYGKIKPLLSELGFTEKLESDHELIWTKPSLYLELHKRVIPSYNKDYAAYFGNGWRLAKRCPEGAYSYQMTDEDQMIYLFTHFAKHYRDGGIGIRHLTDLYVYRRAKPELDEGYLAEELKKLRLYEFYENVCATLAVLFEDAPDNEKTHIIAQVVMNSGVYGSETGHIAAQGVRDKAEGRSTRQVRRKHWRELVFLPYKSMCARYPILEKWAVLLPVMWVVRWISVIFQPHRVRSQHRRMKIMSEERIDSYEQMLHTVGLAFHFKE